ncbi:hypothetical protein Varpa_2789 [Variovorax paradoxus EPS]|uniref:Uncharacterized protein n=1 Tax=Variovorax paradoxus (strain EPS) TaxID=595537 RepID=E6V3V9_VARPE|nr:hypothetical protein Varpa_2789 [Variovorax paradoxus EPS]
MFRLIKIATVAWMAIKWYRRRKTAPAGGSVRSSGPGSARVPDRMS